LHRTLLLAFLVAQELTPQCGSSSTTTPPPIATPSQNVQTIVVNAGPANNYFNGAFTSVTICVPGQSTACQTIDGVLVDTGSSGLRVLGSALTLSLPQQPATTGGSVVECAQFLDGFTWGPVQVADVKLAGEQASSVPIQVIGETAFPTIPVGCTSSGTDEDTLASLGANAILGVGLFRQDCGSACAFVGAANPGLYYACSGTGCQTTAEALVSQVQNPVWLFPTDNNGVVVQLPAVPIGGALSVTGALVYGIGTQANNALGAAKVLTVDANGNITTVYSGQTYASSFIDSGSNGIFFLDAATTGFPLCKSSTDFYCPATLQTLSATNRGVNGATVAAAFSVGNADALSDTFSAFSEIAGPNPGSFDWGLGFFFGRSIYTGLEGQSTPGGPGPYFAY
jgi:hypothetical protein